MELQLKKNKVITVRKTQKLCDVIKSITFEEPTFYWIHIEKSLIDRKNAKHQFGNNFEVEQDGYKVEFMEDEESEDWVWLNGIKVNNECIFLIAMDNFIGVIYEECEIQKIYIRKWGSKAKMDEE